MIQLPEILTLYILNGIVLSFAFIAFILSIQIVLKWDFNATTALQYTLEKKSYLGSTIIKYMFYIKIPLFLFYIFTLDKISFILPGAMCGAGVVNSSDYATILLFLKVINLYLFAYWIVIDKQDMMDEVQKNLKKKFMIYIALFMLLVLELVLEGVMFSAIDLKSVVDCCGAIFSTNDDTYLSMALNLPHNLLVSLFYLNFILMFVVSLKKINSLFAVLNLLFIVIALLSLVSFFGTYIYELPTHHCPFCLLQHEYHYIGYFLYTFLFIGTFNGLVVGFVLFTDNELKSRYKLSLIFNFIYLVLVSYYPISYYTKNGVWM